MIKNKKRVFHPRGTNVGEVLPLTDARLAHEMLAGKPHKRGKIVLTTGK
ncbi:MAG TPA: hypothetical protein VHC46_03180 [Thermodesulfobacteriota bacterium]|nr:hypothetical protein [Thermodesulfobacteriota bacterium]